MTMHKARVMIVVIGIVLPYLARVPQGAEWLGQYTNTGFGGWLFFSALNAIAWGCLLTLSFNYQRPVSLLAPCILGFGFLAWAHGTQVDLNADPQAAIALVIVPVCALGPIAIGGILGYFVDRKLVRNTLPDQ